MLTKLFLLAAIVTFANADSTDSGDLGFDNYTPEEIFSLADEEPALASEFKSLYGSDWSQTIIDAFAYTETGLLDTDYTALYSDYESYSHTNKRLNFFTDSDGNSYTIGDQDYYTDASGNFIDYYTDENGKTQTIRDNLLYFVSYSKISEGAESYETDAATAGAKTGAKESSAAVAPGGTGSNNVATSTSGQQAEKSGSISTAKGAGSGSTTNIPSNSESTAARKSRSGSTIGKGNGVNLYAPVGGLIVALFGAMI